MSTLTLTAENFEHTVSENDLVIVDFWADWCRPCTTFAPTFADASEQHPEIVFGKVDTEAEGDLAAQAGIRSIPTLWFFREQILVHQESGALPATAFAELITQLKALDMDQVRAQLERDSAEAAAAAADTPA